MLRRLALLLGAAMLLWLAPQPSRAAEDPTTYVGPTQILFDGEEVYTAVSREWLSASVRNQEKLLRVPDACSPRRRGTARSGGITASSRRRCGSVTAS